MLEILNKIADEPGKIAKQDILKEVQNGSQNELFQSIVIATFHPTTEYYIKKFDMPETYTGETTLLEALTRIKDVLSTRKLTGNSARDWLFELFGSLTEDDAEVLKRVIKRDLRAGFSSTTVNKIWTDLIYCHPYMRCSGFNEKTIKNIQLPCYTQLKADGLYCDIIVRAESVIYMSRSGKVIDINNLERDGLLMEIAANSSEFVLQGEVLVKNTDGTILERSLSNGYINKDNKDTSRIFIMAWDMIPLEDFLCPKKDGKKSCLIKYDTRLANLTDVTTQLNNFGIVLIDHRKCNTIDEIADHFREVREQGEEGIIIKDSNCAWKDGTSKFMIKLKVIMDVELKIVDWYYGTKGTKNESIVGGICCESEDGKIAVKVGTGISDTERETWVNTLDNMISNGKIVTVKCNGITTSKVVGHISSLFLPRLKEIRIDKTVADSFDKIQTQETEFTKALSFLDNT